MKSEDSPELLCVDPARVSEIWPHVSPLVDLAYAKVGSRDQREAAEKDVYSGIALLWVVHSPQRLIEAFAITDLIKEDDCLVCRIRAVAGRVMRRWLRLIEEIEAYAKRESCTEIRYVGRPGWGRALGPDYKVTHVIAAKRL